MILLPEPIVANQDEYIFDDPTLEIHAKYLDQVREATYFSGAFSYTSIYYNGATYFSWFQDTGTSYQAAIVKYIRGEQLQIVTVGTPPSPADVHNCPTLWANTSTGYIYAMQNDHQDACKVYKSTGSEDISSMSLVGTFGTSVGYLMNLEGSGSDVVFLSRGVAGGGNDNTYCQSVYKVNLDSLVATEIQITSIDYATNAVRHYPTGSPYTRYGTATKTGWLIAHRYDTTGPTLYKFSLLVTNVGDYDTIHNIDGSHSEDVISTAPISESNLETYYALFGTDSSKTQWHSAASMQVGDIFYIFHTTTGTTEIKKIDLTDGTTSTQSITPSGTLTTYSLNYNGTNIVINMLIDGVNVIAKMNTDLTGYSEFADDLSGINDQSVLPQNLPTAVSDGSYYPIIGYKPLAGLDYIIGYYESNRDWS